MGFYPSIRSWRSRVEVRRLGERNGGKNGKFKKEGPHIFPQAIKISRPRTLQMREKYREVKKEIMEVVGIYLEPV